MIIPTRNVRECKDSGSRCDSCKIWCRNFLTLLPLKGEVGISLHLGGLMAPWTSRIMELMPHDLQGFQGWFRKARVPVTQSSRLVPLLWGTSAAMKEFQLLWHCHAGEATGGLSGGQLQWNAQPTAAVICLPCRWTVLGGQPSGGFWWCSTHRLVTITIRDSKGALPKFLTH